MSSCTKKTVHKTANILMVECLPENDAVGGHTDMTNFWRAVIGGARKGETRISFIQSVMLVTDVSRRNEAECFSSSFFATMMTNRHFADFVLCYHHDGNTLLVDCLDGTFVGRFLYISMHLGSPAHFVFHVSRHDF